MNITRIAAAGGATLAVALGGGMAATAASASTHTVALESARTLNATQATYRPSKFWIIWGGPNLFARSLHWSSWNHRTATGTGTLIGQDEGSYNLGHVTLYFHDPVYSQKHGWHYEKLHLIGGHNVVHHWHWSGSQSNWVG
jgi:hypothetical protein